MARLVTPEILVCRGHRKKSRRNGWTFPRTVEAHLRTLTAGRSVLHLFGGRASWGTRLDVDPVVSPDVVGDAWLPPFRRNAFDVVILDPPYIHLNQQTKSALLRAAAYIASHSVIWFHTTWIAGDRHCRLTRGWLVYVGDSAAVRCVELFHTAETKDVPRMEFTRGPAMKYNRWRNQGGLPLAAE